MASAITLSIAQCQDLAHQALTLAGMSDAQARAIARSLTAAEADDCRSHGLYRLPATLKTVLSGQVNLVGEPKAAQTAPGIVTVDAACTFAPLALALGLPLLDQAAREQGIAALVIRNTFHFSALWAEVEPLARQGLAALAMTPSHAWVAPFGGTQRLFGTNPMAFAFPRRGPHPYVFDFATSAAARGEIDLHRRAGKQVPEGWGFDTAGQPTTDPAAILAGAMATFGGHKGSALATMVELLAGALIGDLLSTESIAHAQGNELAPFHGELIIAMDPARFLGGGETHLDKAEALLAGLSAQGARLPSERRYAARARTANEGVAIPITILRDIGAIVPTLDLPVHVRDPA